MILIVNIIDCFASFFLQTCRLFSWLVLKNDWSIEIIDYYYDVEVYLLMINDILVENNHTEYASFVHRQHLLRDESFYGNNTFQSSDCYFFCETLFYLEVLEKTNNKYFQLKIIEGKSRNIISSILCSYEVFIAQLIMTDKCLTIQDTSN